MRILSVEPGKTTDVGPCGVCGDNTRTVSGIVCADEGETAYVIQWTDGKVEDHGAHFDLLMAADPKLAVAVEFRRTVNGPAFTVIDANERQTWNRFPNATRLARNEVIGTPLAEITFAILDAIWLQDDRIADLRGSAA